MFNWLRKYVRHYDQTAAEVNHERNRRTSLPVDQARKEFFEIIKREPERFPMSRSSAGDDIASIYNLDSNTRDFFNVYTEFYVVETDVRIARAYLARTCPFSGMVFIGESIADDYEIALKPSTGEIFDVSDGRLSEPPHKSIYHYLLLAIP